MPGKNTPERPPRTGKAPILGQSHGLSDREGEMIKQMIREEQHSSRELFIPQQDLSDEATTTMTPPTAKVIESSRIRPILEMFNRDFLYGQGRFDEYKSGLIFKWGDGYSRRHIWASVEDGNLLLETSHEKKCDKPYCNGTHHVLTPELYNDLNLINQELGDRFRRPVYESTED
ncbi:hypothetical protein [Dictyobacter aurantiacus]|uniref:Uncharacterized protein n=1 Tax=Dictyobacter aurantiacus TaxID=1936993 RepID=A0A401Z9N9_9CHLR|nr:hypothetical protein [Dictyobacter aurantiacus]GCE03565.1 hypothetical protein KDAU_08940 [Dictyobacter aurantiacus]